MNNTMDQQQQQQLRRDRLGDYAAGGEGHRNKPTTKDKVSNKLRDAADKMHNSIYEKTNPKQSAHPSTEYDRQHQLASQTQTDSQQPQQQYSQDGQYRNQFAQQYDSEQPGNNTYSQNVISTPNDTEQTGYYQGQGNTNGATV